MSEYDVHSARDATYSPFSAPTMQCDECGRPPHGGYCYPMIDVWLAVCFAIIVLFVVSMVMIILAA